MVNIAIFANKESFSAILIFNSCGFNDSASFLGFLNFLVYFWMTLVQYWRYGTSAKSSTTGSVGKKSDQASILNNS